ncbi:MAG: hypothetical protein QXI32_04735 [Candidatus Bathyarchaeia archaeon]
MAEPYNIGCPIEPSKGALRAHSVQVSPFRPATLEPRPFLDRFSVTEILLLGLLLRLVLAPFTGHPWDVKVFISTGRNIAYEHVSPYSYSYKYYYNYPPLFAYWLGLSFFLFLSLGGNPQDTYPTLMILLMKVPVILADTAIAIILYHLVLKRRPDEARRTLVGWVFNPFVIMVSTMWGQIDMIPGLMALLSALYLSEGRLLPSILALAMFFSVKPYPLIPLLVPAIMILLLKTNRQKRFLVGYVLVPVGVFILFSAPFLLWDLSGFYYQLFVFQGTRIGTVHDPWGTFWTPILIFQMLAPQIFSYETIHPIVTALSLFAAFILYGVLIVNIRKWSFDELSSYRVFIAVSMIFYLANRIFEETYLLWCFPCFAFVSSITDPALFRRFTQIALTWNLLRYLGPFYFLTPSIAAFQAIVVWHYVVLRPFLLSISGVLLGSFMLLYLDEAKAISLPEKAKAYLNRIVLSFRRMFEILPA